MIHTSLSALLYIEPTSSKKYDASTARKFLWFKRLVESLIETGQIGDYNERSNSFALGVATLGHHTCVCGANSTGFDILLPNHMATHSLAYHYIAYHSTDVPESEWLKLEQLRAYLSFQVV